MSNKEDEYEVGREKPRGQALCPFCGSSKVFKLFEYWKCQRCEKSFPSPSYGPGIAFGKEARWFGKTTEQLRRETAEIPDKGRRRFRDEVEEHQTRELAEYRARARARLRRQMLIALIVLCVIIVLFTVARALRP